MAQGIVQNAVKLSQESLAREFDRLCRLKEINPSVRQDELEYISQWRDKAQEQIQNADLRLDAVRLILMTPA